MSSSSDFVPGHDRSDRATPFASLSDGTPPQRFSLFAFLIAPFRDVDDRAHYAPGSQGAAKRAKNGATNGHAANGHAANGRASEHNGNGHATNGHATNGHAANGHAGNGFAPLIPSGRRLSER